MVQSDKTSFKVEKYGVDGLGESNLEEVVEQLIYKVEMLRKAMDQEEFFDRQKLKDIVQTYKYLNKQLLSVVERLMVDEFGKKEEFQRWKFDILMQQQNLSK